jgi:hypothetical protein
MCLVLQYTTCGISGPAEEPQYGSKSYRTGYGKNRTIESIYRYKEASRVCPKFCGFLIVRVSELIHWLTSRANSYCSVYTDLVI